MTVKEFHIYVQQGLQNIDSFVYPDMSAEEVDLAANYVLYDGVKNTLKKKINNFELDQWELDLWETLYVTDVTLTPTANLSAKFPNYFYDLRTLTPYKYLHLLQDASYVSTQCKVAGAITTVYQTVPNRLTNINNLYNMLDNSLIGTNKEQPISNFANGILRVFSDSTFVISKIIIDYIKIPDSITYTLTRSCTVNVTSTTVNVTDITKYIVGMPVSGTYIQANTTITAIGVNTITLSLASTRTGTPITENLTFGTDGSTNISLLESSCYELAEQTISYLSKISEQNQQKIVNIEPK